MAERPEDLNLPVTVVQRIIKEALPEGVIVSKEARQTISRASSVFVLYLTACAVTHANKAKRKTLAVNDIISAIGDMEFEQFVQPLNEALKSRKESTASILAVKKANSAIKSASANNKSTVEEEEDDGEEADGEDVDADDKEEVALEETEEAETEANEENVAANANSNDNHAKKKAKLNHNKENEQTMEEPAVVEDEENNEEESSDSENETDY